MLSFVFHLFGIYCSWNWIDDRCGPVCATFIVVSLVLLCFIEYLEEPKKLKLPKIYR